MRFKVGDLVEDRYLLRVATRNPKKSVGIVVKIVNASMYLIYWYKHPLDLTGQQTVRNDAGLNLISGDSDEV